MSWRTGRSQAASTRCNQRLVTRSILYLQQPHTDLWTDKLMVRPTTVHRREHVWPKQQPPTPEKLALFYRQISMTGTGFAILSVLPDYCELFRDSVMPIRSLQSLVNGTGLNRSDLPALQQHCQTIKIIADVSEEQAVQMDRWTRTAHVIPLVCCMGRESHGHSRCIASMEQTSVLHLSPS